MKTLLLTAPVKEAKPQKIRKLVPGDFSGWRIESIPSGSLAEATVNPDVTLVEIDEDTKPAEVKSIIPDLVQMQERGAQPSYVVFSFKDCPKAKPAEVRAQQRRYQNLMTQITGSLTSFPNPQLVDVTFASSPSVVATVLECVRAKLDLQIQVLDVHPPKAPRPSPMDRVHELLSATEDLRVANGKLSATAIAKAFGVSVNELARWLSRSRQSVTKTPDADSLQDDLAFFERVARLRAVVPQHRFLKWLRMPNAQLDGKSPLDLMKSGERQVVVDFVEDMLTGAPT